MFQQLFAREFFREHLEEPFFLQLVERALVDKATQFKVLFGAPGFALNDLKNVLQALAPNPRRKSEDFVVYVIGLLSLLCGNSQPLCDNRNNFSF